MSSLIHTIAATERVDREFMPAVPPTENFALRVRDDRMSWQYYPLFVSFPRGHREYDQNQQEWDRLLQSVFPYQYWYRLTTEQASALRDPMNRFEFEEGGNDIKIYAPDYRVQTLHRFDGEPTYNYFKWQTLCDEADNTTAVLDWLVHHAQTTPGVDKAPVRSLMTERDYRAREFHYRCGVARVLHAFHQSASPTELAAYLQLHRQEQERVLGGEAGHARFTEWNAIAVEFMDSVFPVFTSGPNEGRRGLHPDRAHPAASASQITADFVTPVVERMGASPGAITATMTYGAFDAAYINPPADDSDGE